MFRRKKELQKLLDASRRSLRTSEDLVERLTVKANTQERLIRDISIVLNEKGQGTMVDRYKKIKKLVDDYQSTN